MGILWWGRWWWTWSSKGSSRVRLCKKWSPMLGKKTLDLNHRNKFFFCTRPECAKLGSPGLGFIFLWVWPSHNMPGEMMHFLQESSFIQPKIPKCQIPQIDLNKPSPQKSHQTMIPPKIPSKILRSHVHPRSISVSNRPSIPCCCRWRGSATASARDFREVLARAQGLEGDEEKLLATIDAAVKGIQKMSPKVGVVRISWEVHGDLDFSYILSDRIWYMS